MKNWTCSCGQENTGPFCSACGKVRPRQQTKAVKPEKEVKPKPKENISNVASDSPPVIKSNEPVTKSVPVQENTTNNLPGTANQFKDAITKNKKIVFGVLGCAVLLGLFVAFIGNDKKTAHPTSNRNNSAYTSQSQPTTQSTTQQKPTTASTPQKKNVPDMPSDLGMGGICIGYERTKLFSILGRGKEDITSDRSSETYEYPDMKIWVSDGLVSAIISKTDNIETKRRIHQESTLQEVLNVYGNNYSSFSHEGMTLYEYPMRSLNNWDCLLRFAIKDNRVDYISIRALLPEKPTSAASNPLLAKSVPRELKAQEKQILDAGTRFLAFHQAITDHRFNDAYDCYTSSGQRKRGARENFSNGYENTISSEITSLKAISANANQVVFKYNLKARDRGQQGVHNFAGTVTMVNESGRWGIEDAESQSRGFSAK